MVLASVLLGLSGLIAGVLPFRGDPARVKEVHDPAWPLWIPPLLLAAGGLFIGVAPSILNRPLSTAATAIAGMSVDVSLSVWHGVTPTLLLSLFTLAAVGLSYVVHDAVRARTWKPRHGTEDLYEGALSGLNAVSHAIAPALHSASLRTYVMVIVATSVLVGSAALVTDTGLGSAMPRTGIAPTMSSSCFSSSAVRLRRPLHNRRCQRSSHSGRSATASRRCSSASAHPTSR